MLNTRETDYALRILRGLQDGKLRKLEDLCATEHVPQAFGYKIARKLTKAGWLENVRGAGGGYRLQASLEKLTLYDVTFLLDETSPVSPCVEEDYHCPWKKAHDDHCAICLKFREIHNHIASELQETSLASLIS